MAVLQSVTDRSYRKREKAGESESAEMLRESRRVVLSSSQTVSPAERKEERYFSICLVISEHPSHQVS